MPQKLVENEAPAGPLRAPLALVFDAGSPPSPTRVLLESERDPPTPGGGFTHAKKLQKSEMSDGVAGGFITAEFLNAARQCFQMIDKDNSGTLTKVEIVKAIAEDKDVVKFLRTCGEENLQFLLQPARLEKALDVLDTSKDGEVDIDEWEEAIHRGLAKRLEQLADERERRERAARAEDEAFSAEFLSMAREVFDMIDKDGSGSLDKKEVVTAICTDKKVISFLRRATARSMPRSGKRPSRPRWRTSSSSSGSSAKKSS